MMLVTFSCPAHADITMFGDVAVRLLELMGPTASNFGWRRSVKDVGGRFLGLGFWRLP